MVGGHGRGAAQTWRAVGDARRRGAMALCPFYFDEHLFEHEQLIFFE
jgi:hypothetical protein